VDAEARQPALAALTHEAVHERIAGRVIPLAGGSEKRGSRREEHEEIERPALAQLVQVPRTLDFGVEHGAEPVPRLLKQHAVVERAGRMDDAGKRKAFAIDRGKDALESGAIRDVSLLNLDPRALVFERLDRLERLRR